MGNISERINELAPQIARMYEMAQKCNTRTLRADMLAKIFNAFLLYRPLTYKEHILYVNNDEIVAVHEWIKFKYPWRTKGSYTESHSEFYELICKYGDEMCQYVRRSIKDEFTRLVQLTKQLKPYNELTYRKDVNKLIYFIDERNVTKINLERITAIVIETDDPEWVKLVYGEASWAKHVFDLLYLKNIHAFEDVIDDLMPLYEQAVNDVTTIKEHNDKILEEIKQIIMPRYISNQFEEES